MSEQPVPARPRGMHHRQHAKAEPQAAHGETSSMGNDTQQYLSEAVLQYPCFGKVQSCRLLHDKTSTNDDGAALRKGETIGIPLGISGQESSNMG